MKHSNNCCHVSPLNFLLNSSEITFPFLLHVDRLRDTLIHEMCHAAAWLVSGVQAGHGAVWKKWWDTLSSDNPITFNTAFFYNNNLWCELQVVLGLNAILQYLVFTLGSFLGHYVQTMFTKTYLRSLDATATPSMLNLLTDVPTAHVRTREYFLDVWLRDTSGYLRILFYSFHTI